MLETSLPSATAEDSPWGDQHATKVAFILGDGSLFAQKRDSREMKAFYFVSVCRQ